MVTRMRDRLPFVAYLGLILILWVANASGATIYNYEAYGNTLDGPAGTPFGACTSESFTSQKLSLSNCSSAPGVVTSADSLATFTALHADSSLALSNAVLTNGVTASGYARTVDILSPGSSNVAYLGFTFQVDGVLTDSGLGQARVALSFGERCKWLCLVKFFQQCNHSLRSTL
jgi:hypothetical protein